MRKNTIFLLAVMGVAVMSAAPGRLWAKIELSFKLSGSYGQLVDGAGDVEEARKGMESYFFDLNQMDEYTTTFDWKTPKKTNDFRAELMFRFTRNFALSVGSGYLTAKNPASYTIDYNIEEDYEDYGGSYHFEGHDYTVYSQQGTLSAIPITLDAYVLMPIGKRETFMVFAHVGVGYYFGKLLLNLDMDSTSEFEETTSGKLTYQGESTNNVQMTQKTSSNAFGYHAGIGFDIKLTRFFALGAEAYGRQVVFRNWEGSSVTHSDYWSKHWSEWGGDVEHSYSNTESTFGNLWTYETGCTGENRYTMMWVLDEEPEGKCTHNARKSSINLNSYGITLSLKLRF